MHKSGGSTGQKSARGNSDKANEDGPKSLFPLKSQWLLKDMPYYYTVTFPGQFFFCVFDCALTSSLNLGLKATKPIIFLSIKEQLFFFFFLRKHLPVCEW